MKTGLQAVVFDWAGTIVDFGSLAPMGVFVKSFAQFGIEISIAEARVPMGLPKRAHIAALLATPAIAARWQAANGNLPGEAEIDRLYEVFVPMNIAVVKDFATLIPGARETVAACRQMGLKIGSTTGYTRAIMAQLCPAAAALGYAPDNLVCADDLADGRPTPLMMYRCFADLGVYPPQSVVKVDDTVPGIQEARAAGTWSIGVAVSGNCVGLSLEDWQLLSTTEKAAQRKAATAVLRDAGADEVIDSVADLLPALDRISTRLARGEMPPA